MEANKLRGDDSRQDGRQGDEVIYVLRDFTGVIGQRLKDMISVNSKLGNLLCWVEKMFCCEEGEL